MKARRLFTDLLALEDAFEGGPRVPAVRTYDFLRRTDRPSYRELIAPWGQDGPTEGGGAHIALGHLFHQLGWHRLAPPRADRRDFLETRCHDGALARSWIASDARLGTLSRFPLLAGAEHATWGLSWQSMPVAFASGADGWGFLRWHTREGGLDRHHPARDRDAAYLNNALTDLVSPPIVGRTDSLQHGADAFILRRMPALSAHWETLADELVLIGEEFSVVREESGSAGSRLLLRAGSTPVTVLFFPLSGGARPFWQRRPGEQTWEAVWPLDQLRGEGGVSAVWMICWGREVPLPSGPWPWRDGRPEPRDASDLAWELRWPRADGHIAVRVDPRSSRPLSEVDSAP